MMKDKADRDEFKRQHLPAFCPAGELGRDGKLRDYQNRVVIDVDGVPLCVAEAIRESARDCPECMMAFLSPFFGVKLIFWHELPEQDHLRAYDLAAAKAVELGAPPDAIDRSGTDPNRLCYLSWDSEAFFQESPTRLKDLHIDIQTNPPERRPEKVGLPLPPPPRRGPEKNRSPFDHGSKLGEFFDRWLGDQQAVQGGRNRQVVSSAKFLYHVVSERILKELLEGWFLVNQSVFDDSLAVHRKDIENCLVGVERTWMSGLSRAEADEYDKLNFTERVAFRILRDLGMHEEVFFMACGELIARITGQADCDHGKALLEQFRKRGWLKMEKKGKKWTVGQRPVASSWRWLGVEG